ncbi:MAG: bifunctional DNA-formamidopyrimidine glycosylase/DNA-(apurinic or apyrimidinic site) lyase [Pyrinomonadaceae bacterium]
MPELPEVEFVAKALDKAVRGRTIEASELLRPRLAPGSTATDFAKSIRDCRINSVHRRGKNILFGLENGRTLLAHLRMSGRFMLLPPDANDPKFTHAVFHLDGGSRLVFQDQRHFGLMKVIDTDQLEHDAAIAKLGPEPLSAELSVEYLARCLSASARSLKEFLLDQTKVCGLGNIYACEAMFHAGLSPRRRSRNVPRSRVAVLHRSIQNVLSTAIEVNSLRIPDPVAIGEGVYGEGVWDDLWHVYGREGEECRVCSSAIRRIRQGQRSTFYCGKCQR